MRYRNERGITYLEALVIVACISILVAILFPVFTHGHHGDSARERCQSNVKQLGFALLMYFQDYDEVTLPGHAWPAGLAPYFLPTASAARATLEETLDCPKRLGATGDYGYNDTAQGVAGVSGRLIADQAYTLVLLDFTRDNVGRAVPTQSELERPEVARHMDGINCLFFDGHVRRTQPTRVAQKRFWTRQDDGGWD